jgi:hypothetical protein
MSKNEKYFLNFSASLRPRCALLLSVVGAYNKGYTVQPSARASPKFCSVSLRKTSYIPDVRRIFRHKKRLTY